MKASDFYTGIVADLYDHLVAKPAPAGLYRRLIRDGGEPALELGCGSGHPILDLRADGLDVEGLDASDDMLAICRRKAAARGLHVTLHRQEMQQLDLPRRFRTIFLAGPSFQLLLTQDDAERALERIFHHLEPGGRTVIPLYVPPLLGGAELATDTWRARPDVRREEDGALLRLSERFRYDLDAQLLLARLRYEILRDGAVVAHEEREWRLRWHTQEQFRALLEHAGFTDVQAVRGDLAPSSAGDPAFVMLARRGAAAAPYLVCAT
jgi:SAM-dependent methyltransferase